MLMEKRSTTPTGKRRSTPHCGKYCMVVLTFSQKSFTCNEKKKYAKFMFTETEFR